jgi:hypothetical protein
MISILLEIKKDINEARHHLKTKFEMKDLSETKFCLGIQIEYLLSGIYIYQLAYIYKVLEKFNMDKAYPVKTPMVVRSLDMSKDPFLLKDEGEEILGSEFLARDCICSEFTCKI